MITFVTGKGGVGKSTVALTMFQKQPNALLAETSPGLLPLAKARGLNPAVIRYTREDLAHDFLLETLKLETLVNLLLKSPLFTTLLSLAPNLNDILLLEKWIELSREQSLIVDAPATGHFIALLESVQTAETLFDGGSLKRKAERIRTTLQAPGAVQVLVVSIPEHSSLEESRQIENFLKRVYPTITVRRVLNRLHQKPVGWETSDPHLRALAFERPAREEERIKHWQFADVFEEGAT